MADDSSASDVDAALAELTPERIRRNQRIYADFVDRYYSDPDFKAEVDTDPTRVLRAEGLDIPEGVTVKLLFNTWKLLHIVLPTSPE